MPVHCSGTKKNEAEGKHMSGCALLRVDSLRSELAEGNRISQSMANAASTPKMSSAVENTAVKFLIGQKGQQSEMAL